MGLNILVTFDSINCKTAFLKSCITLLNLLCCSAPTGNLKCTPAHSNVQGIQVWLRLCQGILCIVATMKCISLNFYCVFQSFLTCDNAFNVCILIILFTSHINFSFHFQLVALMFLVIKCFQLENNSFPSKMVTLILVPCLIVKDRASKLMFEEQ